MSYQIVETTSEGFVVHNADTAETALSMWYGLDGEVSAIRDEHQEIISLPELIAIVAAQKPMGGPSKTHIEVEENEELEVDEGKEENWGDPIGRFPPRA